MLGTKTKHIVSYGRRGHRIVNASDDRSSEVGDATISGVYKPSRRINERTKPPVLLDPSPPSSPESTHGGYSSPEFMLKKTRDVTKTYRPTQTKKRGKVAPDRKPLSAVSANIISGTTTGPSSPFVAQAAHKKPKPVHRKVSGQGTPKRASVSLKPVSPTVEVEIIILDDSGQRVNTEKRINKPAAPTVPAKRSAQNSKQKVTAKKESPVSCAIVLSDDDDYTPPGNRARKPAPPRKRRVVYSSDDGSDIEIVGMTHSVPLPEPSRHTSPLSLRPPAKQYSNVVPTLPSSSGSTGSTTSSQNGTHPSAHRVQAETTPNYPSDPKLASQPKTTVPNKCRPSTSQFSHTTALLAPPGRSRPRPLTPIRFRGGFPLPPSPPSSPSDSELDESLSFDLSELALSPKTLRDLKANGLTWEIPKQPAYLRPLLEECGQDTPHEFSAFIEMFPFDQIVQTSHDGVDIQVVANDGNRTRATFCKIGEASYSEVFGIGDVVLKIIPLRNEDDCKPMVDEQECPSPSDAKDVLKEVIVTRAMGQTCCGFTKLLRTYVVRGKYPSLLLDLWDEYCERKGSDSVRPGKFKYLP